MGVEPEKGHTSPEEAGSWVSRPHLPFSVISLLLHHWSPTMPAFLGRVPSSSKALSLHYGLSAAGWEGMDHRVSIHSEG